MWLNADAETIGLPKVLVDKSSKVSSYGEEANTLYQQKKQEELLDNINVLYVALTRAEEQLYIISGMQTRNKTSGEYPNNMATFFIKFIGESFDENQLDYAFGQADKLSETETSTSATQVIPQLTATLHPKNIKIAQKESLMWNTQQQKAIEFGTILHEILSFVNTSDDIELALTKAIENGLIIGSQKETIAQTLEEVVAHQDLLPYFASGNTILNEQTIIQKEGHLVKPDRMVVNPNKEIYLLDYKTGAHQSKYTTQLENYQNAIEKMGFKVTKKALVYIGERLEVVNL
jgi:ATP-dependent exoDNAse (exonuclease V) beta subunit